MGLDRPVKDTVIKSKNKQTVKKNDIKITSSYLNLI